MCEEEVSCMKRDITYIERKTKVRASKTNEWAKGTPLEKNPRRYPCEQQRCIFQSS
jgi:hypothetical protein